MAIVSKTNRDGIDVVIETLQQSFYPGLIGSWDVDAVYQSYPRANKNYIGDNIIPEISLNQKEYNEVLTDDKFSVTSFWLNNDNRLFQDDNKQIKQSISVIFQCDLVSLYGGSERLDEQFNMDVLRVLKAENKFIVGDINIDEGIDNVYAGLSISGELKEQLKLNDLSDQHVVKFTFDVLYKDTCNRPVNKVCPGVSISLDGVFSEVVPGGGSYNCVQSGNPAENQVNGVSKTDIPSGGSKNFIVRYADDSPVVVTEVSDSDSVFIGEVPNPPTADTARPTKTGAIILGSFYAGDNASTDAGRGASFYNLDSVNPFGHLKRYTGKTGGYYDDVSLDYKTVLGVVTVKATAFPDDVVLDWASEDKENDTVLAYSLDRTVNQNFSTTCSNAPYDRASLSDWRLWDLNEWSRICNQGINRNWLNYPPFNFDVTSSADYLWIGYSDNGGAAAWRYTPTQMGVVTINGSYKTVLVRNYTLASLGL